jgi:hypothetical protein
MTPRARNFAQLFFVAGGAASVAVAPIADADPTGVPEVGSESASATIQDLRAEGFNVSISWTVEPGSSTNEIPGGFSPVLSSPHHNWYYHAWA